MKMSRRRGFAVFHRVAAMVVLLSCRGLAFAQAQAGSDWTKVQAVQAGTMIRIASQRPRTICSFAGADEDSLRCTRTRTILFFPLTQRLRFARREVQSVKLSRQFFSGLAAGGIGAGVGAGVGAGIETQYSSKEDGHLLTAALAILGGALGAAIGARSDFLAGPTVYRAP